MECAIGSIDIIDSDFQEKQLLSPDKVCAMEQKIKQDRRIMQIDGCDMTRECLVKIERCTQHIQASQLQAIRKALNTTYDALIDGIEIK